MGSERDEYRLVSPSCCCRCLRGELTGSRLERRYGPLRDRFAPADPRARRWFPRRPPADGRPLGWWRGSIRNPADGASRRAGRGSRDQGRGSRERAPRSARALAISPISASSAAAWTAVPRGPRPGRRARAAALGAEVRRGAAGGGVAARAVAGCGLAARGLAARGLAGCGLAALRLGGPRLGGLRLGGPRLGGLRLGTARGLAVIDRTGAAGVAAVRAGDGRCVGRGLSGRGGALVAAAVRPRAGQAAEDAGGWFVGHLSYMIAHCSSGAGRTR